jgi:glycosyltransferase involved in cell wall biosynthesis
MNILMMIEELQMGGAQTFFVRLAVGLRQRGHTVVVHLVSRDWDASLLKKLAEADIPVFVPWWRRPAIYRWVYKCSLELQWIFKRFCLVDLMRNAYLRRLHRRHRFDVANAHTTHSERAACVAFRKTPVRIVGTDHGEYRCTIPPERFPEMEPVFSRSDGLVCPSVDNLTVAKQYPWSSRCRLQVVYYGYEFPSLRDVRQPDSNKRFLFGMLARGNEEEKGWREAVEAFRILRKQLGDAVGLLLVGGGRVIDDLRKNLNSQEKEGIELAGYQADPHGHIARFDVGLLPTYYRAESLPCAIIEMLAQGKPVIATRIAGIPEMLTVDSATAGALIPLDQNGKASVTCLSENMLRFVEDPTWFYQCKEIARQAARRFSMERCLMNYTSVFNGQEVETDPTARWLQKVE